MYSRLFSPPKKSYFLFGPRGTGKSTLLKKLYPEAVFFNLLMERQFQKYLVDPEIFYNEVQAIPEKTWIVVDEIQRLPSLLNYVHQLIEEKKWNFVLTGSSARKLKKSGVNLLAGRAITRSLFPFLPEELGKDFKLDHNLRYGSLPIVLDSDEKEETLQSYVETYLRQEIKEEALVNNLSGFSRFLNVAALLHGQSLNVSNVAREAEVSRTTVNGFFEILEDTLIGYRLPAYSAKLRLRESKHPKFYFFDSGVVRVLKKKSGPIDIDEIGSLLEGFVLHLLRSYQSYSKICDEIFYWQPTEANSAEVDFLLKKESSFCAIEVKATHRVRKQDLTGLHAISQLPGLKRKILVYRGNETQRIDKEIEVMPIPVFCKALSEGKIF
jgi:predicted AAA+ superfamily ATPase